MKNNLQNKKVSIEFEYSTITTDPFLLTNPLIIG